jgi:Kef-type K+ transport system membrane component KefB
MLNPAVTLALIMGLTWITFRVATPTLADGRLAIFLGFVLLSASVAGALAAATGLPRITGFIVIGIVVGPSSLGLLTSDAVAELRLIDSFALALIAMLAGGELRLEALRPHAKVILMGTLVITALVWVGMTAVVLAMSPFIPFLGQLPFTGTLAVAVMLGVWAANSSPDLTVAVIEEKHAQGDLVEVVLGITIVKDVFVIVLLTLTLSLVAPLLDPSAEFSSEAVTALGREVGGALLLGSAMGWVFSQYLGGNDRNPRSPLATFLFAYVMVVLADELHVELLLTGVAAGFVIENLSPAGDRMIQGIRAVAVVVFAFFFTIAGASLDLGAVLRFGPAAVVFLLARGWLTRFAAAKALRLASASDEVRERTWLGLISQGGVTLGLILLAADRLPALGPSLVAFGMVVILGNILAGPILLGRALAGSTGARAKRAP